MRLSVASLLLFMLLLVIVQQSASKSGRASGGGSRGGRGGGRATKSTGGGRKTVTRSMSLGSTKRSVGKPRTMKTSTKKVRAAPSKTQRKISKTANKIVHRTAPKNMKSKTKTSSSKVHRKPSRSNFKIKRTVPKDVVKAKTKNKPINKVQKKAHKSTMKVTRTAPKAKKTKVKVLQPKVVRRKPKSRAGNKLGNGQTLRVKNTKKAIKKAKKVGKSGKLKQKAKKLQQKVTKAAKKVTQKAKNVAKKVKYGAFSSSGGKKRPTGPTKDDMSPKQLKSLLKQSVVSARIVERRMSTTDYLPNLEKVNPDWRNMHSGLEVITADGGRYLIHKGENYGRAEGGDTVVTDAKNMKDTWKEKSAWKNLEKQPKITDLVRKGGKHYSALKENCNKASRELYGVDGD